DQVGSIADRGREILKLATGAPKRAPDAGALARRLLAQRGEASGLALAQDLAMAIRTMDRTALEEFLLVLARDFACDSLALEKAIEDWRRQPGDRTLARLRAAVETPRQELFRRLNMAPDGTGTIVELRRLLLQVLPERPE